MGYVVATRNALGAIECHHESDEWVARDVADAFLCAGIEVAGIEAGPSMEPLSLIDVLNWREKKAEWRRRSQRHAGALVTRRRRTA